MAERWHVPPWVIGSARLGDDAMAWWLRQAEWDKAKSNNHG